MSLNTPTSKSYLPGQHQRARWLRFDAARILKRYFFCERALVVAQSAWIASIADLNAKLALPEWSWQDAMTAHALRERVFELRYPSRLMEIGEDAPVVDVFAEAVNAPSAQAFVLALARVYKPALLAAYDEYIGLADELSDGPVLRALRMAVSEKSTQVAALTRVAQEMARKEPELTAAAEAWASSLGSRLLSEGGLSVEAPLALPADAAPLAGRTPYRLPDDPARDPSFHRLRFYWPDVVDPDYPYGEGIQLQLRSAVSHINEAWAVESGGAILHAFAGELDWEFIYDAARWTWDEARHTRMGYERLTTWGFAPEEIPLGNYIYASARGQDPIVRLGMLHYFETKNIGKKTKRAAAFGSYADRMSQHDMDFDWADETIHAEYGHRWLEALHERLPERVPEIDVLRALCDELVAAEVATASASDRAEIRAVADRMVAKAAQNSA
jgi:hypothetical protein